MAACIRNGLIHAAVAEGSSPLKARPMASTTPAVGSTTPATPTDGGETETPTTPTDGGEAAVVVAGVEDEVSKAEVKAASAQAGGMLKVAREIDSSRATCKIFEKK